MNAAISIEQTHPLCTKCGKEVEIAKGGFIHGFDAYTHNKCTNYF